MSYIRNPILNAYTQVVSVFVRADYFLLTMHVFHHFFKVGFSFNSYPKRFRPLSVSYLFGYVDKGLTRNTAKIQTITAHVAGLFLDQQNLYTDGMCRQGHT